MMQPSRGERPDLSPFAARSSDSRGREHPDEFRDGRPARERDRDRVIHSAAFRRLGDQAQIFVKHEKVYYRTQLAHNPELAQIARGRARRLGLDEELAEALTPIHNLGHTPCGHTGEEAVGLLPADQGGRAQTPRPAGGDRAGTCPGLLQGPMSRSSSPAWRRI